MDNEKPQFLPSEVARLVLGYLENEGYTTTYKSFMKECIYLQEYIALLKRGRQYPLTINGLSLIEMLDKYAQIFIVEQKKESTSISALWSQLEAVSACLKRQTSSKSLRVEGCSQNTRTRRAMILTKFEQEDKAAKRNQTSAQNIPSTTQNVMKSPERLSSRDPARILIIPSQSDAIPNAHHSNSNVLFLPERSHTKHSPPLHKSPSVKLKSKSVKGRKPSHIENDNKGFESANKISPKDEISATKNQLYSNNNIFSDYEQEDSSSINKLVIKTPEKKSDQNSDSSDVDQMDNGAGLQDDPVDCDNNAQLSPLPTSLRNDDVKDSSGEGNHLSGSCDKANLEKLNDDAVSSREILTASNVSGEKLSSIPKDNATHVVELEHTQACNETNKKTFSEKDSTDKSVEMEVDHVDSFQPTDNEKEVVGSSPAKRRTSLGTSVSIPSQPPPSTTNTSTLNTQTTSELTSGQRQDQSQTESVVPGTPKKKASNSNLPMVKTPGKNIRDYGFHGQGKSPRRKRPPKRKSHGDSIKDRRASTNMNESSNSNDGSVHDNSFPTQFLEQLLNNPLLHEKLAENINKTINCSDLSKSQNISDASLIQDTSKIETTTNKPSTSLEDILDPHETQMTEGQINHIIDMTKGDTVFDSLFHLFNQDAGNFIDEERILKENNNIENLISGANVNPTVNPSTQISTSSCLTLNLEPSSGFKPINSADVLNSDDLLSFPTISKDVYDKSFENKYVSEDSIQAVLNPISTTRTRTLNTPTDFSIISTDKFNSEHHSNVSTSVSSSIAPTVTISTSSQFVRSEQSSPCTTITSQSCSQVFLRQSSSIQSTQCSSISTEVSYSDSKCFLTVSQTPLSKEMSSIHQTTDFRTPSSTPVATMGSSQGSKTSTYVSFVKGVTDNSSTPVCGRDSPSTVQLEDNPDIFQDLPPEVKNLYSSFEQTLSDLSTNQETTKDEQTTRKTRSSEKNVEISPKLSICKQKLSSKKKTSEKTKSTSSSKITSNSSKKVDKNVKGKKVSISKSKVTESKADKQNKDVLTLNEKSNSTKPDKKSSPKDSKSTDSRKTSPVPTKKDNKIVKDTENITPKAKGKPNKQPEKKSTPKPQIRCDPLQPKNDKSLKSTPKASHTKWSSGLTALIKIASPEKSKPNTTENTPTPVSTSVCRISKELETVTATVNEVHSATISPSTNTCRSNVAKNTVNTDVAENLNQKQRMAIHSPKPLSLKSKPQKQPETFLCGISPISKEIVHIPVKERKVESSQNILLESSCVNVKGNPQTVCSSSETARPNTEHTNTVLPLLSMPLLDGSSPYIPVVQRQGSFTCTPAQQEISISTTQSIVQPGISVSTTQPIEQPVISASVAQPIVQQGKLISVAQPIAQQGISLAQICNNVGITPQSTNHPHLPPFMSDIPNSNLADTYYSESVDFLESPRKHCFKTVSDTPRSSQKSGQTAHNTPVQTIYTATPFTDLISSQQIHVRTLDIETDRNSSQSPKPLNSRQQSKKNQVPLVKVPPVKRGKKSEQKIMPKTCIKKTVLEVFNSDKRKNLDTESNTLTGINVNIGQNNATQKPETVTKPPGISSVVDGNVTKSLGISSVMDGNSKSLGISSVLDGNVTKSLGISSVMDGNVSFVIDNNVSRKTVIKDMSIYRPLSETESEDGSNSIIHTPGQMQNDESSNDSDFIPDAAGNVHMQNGKVMRLLTSPNSKSTVTDSPQQKSLQLKALPKKDTDFISEKFVVSPACQKLIGQIGGLPAQYEKHLGQPLNTHPSRSRSSNAVNQACVSQVPSETINHNSCGSVPSPGPVLSMPVVFDIHLDREKSNDTCSTVNSGKNMMQRESDQAKFLKIKNTPGNFSPKVHEKGDNIHVGLKNKLCDDNGTRSPFSTDSEDIDIEGDWENPWTSQLSALSNDNNDVTLTENSNETSESEADTFTSQDPGEDLLTSSFVTGQTGTMSTSQNAQLTAKLLMSPPKKRVTASMKVGGGLYFVSTKGNDNGNKPETSNKTFKTKKTPKKTQEIFTDLRRSPRIKATTQKSGKQSQQVEKVKKNLTDFDEKQKAKCDLLKSGNKRLRDESDEDSLDKDSRQKTKKCKTPVDLTTLNVDKFLTKLYKA